ncbi:DUF1223 domain-containing protein [Mucilaginibacter sp. 21P]|uniref:DUF1223 domain-containing protein n=1 Tax=Mucilaginibacter sp. 21P TaxID=2778902 RepID=UPI001C55A18C|nr:DUF1223 domain-containing protein [Mucilaginibacter sp. 21P]QXV65971.1 DUF1223 domain-containing protein [Mucilaginibacter sp. 21P]
MKSTKIFSFLFFAVLAGLGSLSFSDQNIQKTPVDKGFAVVELFTSEGCSSCPPADAVVAKIEKEMNGQPVYILAYHVDYWNRLGWKDVFSSADYSKRQNTYANWLNLSSVYTPQIVVNGKTEFVGSQEGTLRKAINTGLKQPAQTNLSLDNFKVNNGSATLNYHTEAAPGQALVLALVKKQATIAVRAGENSGRTLSHVQIVANIQNIRVNASSGEATLKLPPDFDEKQFELIAFVQDGKTGTINGATKLDL